MSERYAAAPGVAWTVERRGVLLLGDGGRMLAYPEAAIWDLLVRGNTLDQVSGKLSAIAGVPAEAARRLTGEWVERWSGEGLLTPGGSRG